MNTFYKLAKIRYSTNALFRIPTDIGDMFMCVSRTNALNDERYVVEVDAKRFVEFWRNTIDPNHYELANGNILTWRKDKKYSKAEEGFSHGEINPVPLAIVNCSTFANAKAHINFSNGITRTIYLLTQNVERFPVECVYFSNAKLLHEIAGFSDGRFMSVEELIPNK